MSAIAWGVRLPNVALDRLRIDYDRCLREQSQSEIDYDWSGYFLVILLSYLEEHGIDLMKSTYDVLTHELSISREMTIFILTPDHRDRYLSSLDPARFSADELRDYYNAFNETNEPQAGEAMLSGIEFLRQSLAGLRNGSVVVCNIG